MITQWSNNGKCIHDLPVLAPCDPESRNLLMVWSQANRISTAFCQLMWHSTILFAATEEGYKNISVLKHLEHHQFCAGFHSISGLVYLFMVTAIFCNSIAQTSHCTYAAPNEPEAITQMEYTLHPFEYHIHETDTLWGLNRTMICYNEKWLIENTSWTNSLGTTAWSGRKVL